MSMPMFPIYVVRPPPRLAMRKCPLFQAHVRFSTSTCHAPNVYVNAPSTCRQVPHLYAAMYKLMLQVHVFRPSACHDPNIHANASNVCRQLPQTRPVCWCSKHMSGPQPAMLQLSMPMLQVHVVKPSTSASHTPNTHVPMENVKPSNSTSMPRCHAELQVDACHAPNADGQCSNFKSSNSSQHPNVMTSSKYMSSGPQPRPAMLEMSIHQ